MMHEIGPLHTPCMNEERGVREMGIGWYLEPPAWEGRGELAGRTAYPVPHSAGGKQSPRMGPQRGAQDIGSKGRCHIGGCQVLQVALHQLHLPHSDAICLCK